MLPGCQLASSSTPIQKHMIGFRLCRYTFFKSKPMRLQAMDPTRSHDRQTAKFGHCSPKLS